MSRSTSIKSLCIAALLVGPAAVGTGAAIAQPVPASPEAVVLGVWINPRQSVQVRTERCGDRLCGTIVHAAPSAVTAAQAKGVDPLVGIKVFEDMQRRDGGVWRGKLYVPDRGGRFASTLTLLDRDRLQVRGCILGGLICRSQIWTRVD